MRSIASVNVMRQVLSRIEDLEHLLWGDLDQASAGLMRRSRLGFRVFVVRVTFRASLNGTGVRYRR